MMRDVPPCFRLVGTDACTVDNRVDLLWTETGGPPITAPVWPLLSQQLMQHEATLTQAFVAQPWRSACSVRIVAPAR